MCGSKITIVPGKVAPGKGKAVYVATIHFPDGSECPMSFKPGE